MIAQIMLERYGALAAALAGYAKTGIPLIASGPGGLAPAGVTDDVGIYYFIPALARVLNVSLDRAIELFFGGLVVGALAVGLVGCLLLFRSLRARLAAVVALPIISYLSWRIGDVYVVPAALAVAIVPWLLYALTDRVPAWAAAVVGIAVGLAVGAAHYTRSHSGTALLLLFAIVGLFGHRISRNRRIWLAAFSATGLLVPVAGFRRLVAQRDGYLAARGVPVVEARHGFWHSVYIGFGFLSNEHGIRYEDAVAQARARQRSPNVVFGSSEYERILREEVFTLAKEDPRLVGQTLFAKFGVLSFYLLLSGGIGFALALRGANPRYLDLAFAAAIAFSSLSAILIMPSLSYLTGAIAFCILYGLVGIEHATAQRANRTIPAGAERA